MYYKGIKFFNKNYIKVKLNIVNIEIYINENDKLSDTQSEQNKLYWSQLIQQLRRLWKEDYLFKNENRGSNRKEVKEDEKINFSYNIFFNNKEVLRRNRE